MFRRIIVGFVAVLLALPASAQDLRSSIQRAASQAAAQQEPQENHGMPKGFLWTGVGLLGYAGFLVALGESYGPDHLDCPGGNCSACTPDRSNCPTTQKVLFKGAAVFAASGLTLLVIGGARAHAMAPRVTFRRRGFAIQQPVPLHFKRPRAAARE